MPESPFAVRPPAVAGQFYPDHPGELRRLLEELLDQAPCVETEDDLVGLFAPHAGYPYSGPTAAAAYRQVRGRRYDTVVILAPSHREPCNRISVYSGQAYETPLGEVPVDRELAGALARHDEVIRLSTAGHGVAPPGLAPDSLRGEHAVEVHLPFLQTVLPGLQIVPIVMDSRDLDTCRRLADALAGASKEKKILLVASSDLYHGYDYAAGAASDARTMEAVRAFDPERFSSALESGQAQACGGGPILTLMLAARHLGADRAQVVERTNAVDVSGGPYYVGYAAALFFGLPARTGGRLPETDRQALGRIARDAVERAARGKRPAPPALGAPGLRAPGRAFVTLRLAGRLRGCIGDIQGSEPLESVVQRMAVAAALHDPRFSPLTESELDGLELEISVLGPLRRIADPSEIEVGRHGLLIRRGRHQGLLLPQVAAEQGWDRARFLVHTCAKAQLPPDAWRRSDTEIYTFTADIFQA